MTKTPAQLITYALALAAAASLAGCGTFGGKKQGGGTESGAPDEFRVVTKPPLVIPPEYSLRPPKPGDTRGAAVDTRAQAQAALFGRDIGADASPGERALVTSAGAQAVDGAIRNIVDQESADLIHKSEEFSNRVLAFKDGADPLGPQTEDAILAEAEATRRVTGGEAVLIERKAKQKTKLPGL